jgi:dinuclear metal center YbgI/SA1388 family protein
VPLLSQILEKFEGFWPEAHADDWDRVGLVTGSPNQGITKVLVAVDLTTSVIEEAKSLGAELILTHHPVLLKGVNYLGEDSLKGSLITKLIRSNIACFSAHTNADVQTDGASSQMARAFGLNNLRPLVPSAVGFGHGVIGELASSKTLLEFSKVVETALPSTARGVAIAGDSNTPIKTVAICSGAGDAFIGNAIASDADVFVTSDLRHHPVLDALQTPRGNRRALTLIDVSHYAAESLWIASAIARLKELSGLQAVPSTVITDPWTLKENNNA